MKNHSHCIVCKQKINSYDIINYSFNKIYPEKENDNSVYKIYGNKNEYYCFQCNKNFLISDEEKLTHKEHLVIPNLKVYEKKDIIIFAQEMNKKLI